MFFFILLACADKSPTDSSPSGIEVTQISEVSGVLDASPSADASGDFTVDGSTLSEVGVGEIAAIPGASGLVVNPGGEVVYVADGSQVWMVTLEGGGSSVVPGSEGTEARALDYANAELLLAGVDSEGQQAVLRITASGVVVEATGFSDPLTGVVQGPDGTVYAAGGDTVYSISNHSATALVTGVTLGSPAGLALTPDASTLMVSSLSGSGSAQVLLILLSDGSTSTFDEVISANSHSGGLHQAPGAPGIYTWSDYEAGVYRVHL